MSSIKIVKEDNFEERKQNFLKNLETNESLRKANDNITYKKGTKLTVEIEITDEYLSDNVIGLLYNKVEGQENLGFKINQIGQHPYAAPNNRDMTVMEIENVITNMIGLLNIVKGGGY